MSRNGKVVVAMSGGVDSSVAACLLMQQGYDCVGVFMRVGDPGRHEGGEGTENREQGTGERRRPGGATDQNPDRQEAGDPRPDREGGRSANADAAVMLPVTQPRRLKHGCCSVADALDARAIAGKLGIPFYTLNFQADFGRIVEYFVDEYAHARTPNPCVMCNIHLKFGKLLRYADLLDAEFVATGHYARVVRDGGTARLARAANIAKDQSYVLFGIRRDDIARCLFPLGDIGDKAEVRRLAAELGLKVHDKPDSQEICFVPDNDYAALVREWRPETIRDGAIVDEAGQVLAMHHGITNFTIGQRRGLRYAAGEPRYVTRLDAETNTVVVGPRESLFARGLVAREINWLVDPPPIDAPQRAAIKIRHMHAPAAGQFVHRADGSVAATFDEPQSAVMPGQAAVWYRDDGVVLGGGWIESGVAEA